jgi:hypothetical protein
VLALPQSGLNHRRNQMSLWIMALDQVPTRVGPSRIEVA